MFQQKLCSGLVSSMLGGLRCMSQFNGIQPKRNPFQKETKEKLPDLPNIELISSKDSNIEAHLSSRKVKYGDYEFIECTEGYVLTYINGYLRRNEPKDAFYGVFYGSKNPLNISGPVDTPHTLIHAKETAVLRAIETLPDVGIKKLCICIDCTATIRTIGRLHSYSENRFRSFTNDAVLRTKDTLAALNKALRLRNDIQYRFLYSQTDVLFNMKEAKKLATKAAL